MASLEEALCSLMQRMRTLTILSFGSRLKKLRLYSPALLPSKVQLLLMVLQQEQLMEMVMANTFIIAVLILRMKLLHGGTLTCKDTDLSTQYLSGIDMTAAVSDYKVTKSILETMRIFS